MSSSPVTSLIHRVWLNHLRPQINPILFPRDFGLGRYPFVENEQEYLIRLGANFKYDSFVAVYNHLQIQTKVIDTLFIDIDIDGDKQAEEFEKIKNIAEAYRSGVKVYYSGNKGFHLFFVFDFVKKELITKAGVRVFATNKLGLGGVDPAVILDMRRMSRVPLTLNNKTDLYCLPLPLNIIHTLTFDRVKEIAKVPYYYATKRLSGTEVPYLEEAADEVLIPDNNIIREVIALSLESKEAREYGDAEGGMDGGREVGWIERLLKTPVRDARHRITWLILSPYLVNVKQVGIPEAKKTLLDYLTKCNDLYRMDKDGDNLEALVDYYISYANSVRLMPPRLSTLKESYPDVYEVVVG